MIIISEQDATDSLELLSYNMLTKEVNVPTKIKFKSEDEKILNSGGEWYDMKKVHCCDFVKPLELDESSCIEDMYVVLFNLEEN